jgi:TRAP-type C4-dicarboxylate transport system substrate-binding protein
MQKVYAEKGFYIGGWSVHGFRVTTANKPVYSPDDLKGLTFRVMQNDFHIEAWQNMGATPTPFSFSELYTALQQGTVSAQDNPLHEIVSRKFYEVQPYITLTDAVYTPFYMAMSKITWDAMSESQQALIVEAAAVGRAAQHKLNEEATAAATQVLLDAGCTIEENPDKAAFQEVAMGIWPLFTDKYGTELLDMIQK